MTSRNRPLRMFGSSSSSRAVGTYVCWANGVSRPRLSALPRLVLRNNRRMSSTLGFTSRSPEGAISTSIVRASSRAVLKGSSIRVPTRRVESELAQEYREERDAAGGCCEVSQRRDLILQRHAVLELERRTSREQRRKHDRERVHVAGGRPSSTGVNFGGSVHRRADDALGLGFKRCESEIDQFGRQSTVLRDEDVRGGYVPMREVRVSAD